MPTRHGHIAEKLLSYVDTDVIDVNDCMVYSDDMQCRITNLQKVLKEHCHSLQIKHPLHGVTSSFERTRAASNWPPPKCSKELKSYLEVANFYTKIL